MRLVLTTQVFPPEHLPTAIMAHELAAGLARRGWSVTVAAGLPHHPIGVVPPGYGGAPRTVEEIDGYRVVRAWHPTSRKRTAARRASLMAIQSLAVVGAALTCRRPDVVVSFGGPPLLGPCLSGAAAALWRVPLVSVIHDIYPDVAVESGFVKSPLIVRPARAFERLQYRLSDRIVVLGEATRDLLVRERNVDAAKLVVLPVWLDKDELRPGPRDNPWRREHGIPGDSFVVLYSGTAGHISGAEILAKVARKLPADVTLLVVGGGSSWSELDRMARCGEAPRNLRVIPYQPRERLSEVQATADLSMLTLLPGMGRTSVPSKVQGYMAAGRPVLAVADEDCDTSKLIRRGQFGSVLENRDPDAIAAEILALRAAPDRLARWGVAAREVFEREHDREMLIARYDELLRSVAGFDSPSLQLAA